MNLQTKIPLQPQHHNQIDYQSNVLLIGSCFVENIGSKLNYFKFQNLQNPLGIFFHPIAIETLITNAINEKKYNDDNIFSHNEQWHCYEAHSKLSSSSKEILLDTLNNSIRLTNEQIHKATHIIITLGTAWVYRHIETDIIVSNCHKVPQKEFDKELLSIDDISKSLQNIVALIKSVNPEATIVFTVSPVRHLKDGFVENTQSKSHLIAAILSVLSPRAQSRGLHYFPSYEIMMDELRDYRFYAEDMIHPSQTAISYIWERFNYVWIATEAKQTMEDVGVVQKGLRHKPFNPNSEAHQKFLQNLEMKMSKLQSQFYHIVF